MFRKASALPNGPLHFDGSLELREEPQVVLEIVTQVVDLPLEHRDALQTHSEGETAVLAAVDSGSLEDIRINHSAAHDLEPAGALADVAALAVAMVQQKLLWLWLCWLLWELVFCVVFGMVFW